MKRLPELSTLDTSIQTSSSILCVGNGWFPVMPGGLNRYVYELIHQLARKGDRVELCGVGLPKAETAPGLAFTNFALPHHPVWQRLWSARQCFLHREVAQVDAINLHFAFYSFPVLDLLPESVPLTLTFHGPWALESERETPNKLNVWAKQWIEARVYQRCDRFIVLSQAFADLLHHHHQVPWSKIHQISGGVDIQRFQPNLSRQQAREQLGWSSDRFILFTPRRLVQRMGIENLLTALAQVKSSYPDVWLAIAGRGTLREPLEQQAVALGLENHVKFLGYLPDQQLPIAYQAADLTVVPSLALEGFGLILLESLASGTPVLCTPVGGMPEVLAGFAPELVTPSTDANAIAARLQDVLAHPLLLPSRNACREYAALNFDWSIIVDKVRDVLLAKI